MFFDLNIPAEALSIPNIFCHLEKSGYMSCAISQRQEGNFKTLKPCSLDMTSIRNQAISQVKPQKAPVELMPALKYNLFTVYSRLDIVLDLPAQTAAASSTPAMQSYDILAVQPTTEKTFQIACQQLEVDIIVLDLTQRLPFYLKHPSINSAISRGIVFEITYSPALRDVTTRRNMMSNAMSLVKVTKGKNIIVSSQLLSLLELRGTFDIMNMYFSINLRLTLFSMDSKMARDALTTNCLLCINHAVTRKHTNKGVFAKVKAVEPVDTEIRKKIKLTT